MKLMTKVERLNMHSVDIRGLRAFSRKTVLVVDCPRSGPGQVRGIFSGPGPGPPGSVQPPAGPGPGPHWTGSTRVGPGPGQVRTRTWLIFFQLIDFFFPAYLNALLQYSMHNKNL